MKNKKHHLIINNRFTTPTQPDQLVFPLQLLQNIRVRSPRVKEHRAIGITL